MSDNPTVSWHESFDAQFVVIADEDGNVLARVPVDPGTHEIEVPLGIMEAGKPYRVWPEE